MVGGVEGTRLEAEERMSIYDKPELHCTAVLLRTRNST